MTNTLLSKSSRVIYLLQLFSFISLLAYVCGVSVVCVCCVPSSLAFQMQFYAVASCVLALLAVSVHFYSFVVVASVFDSAQCTMFVNVFQHFFQPFRFFFLHLFFFYYYFVVHFSHFCCPLCVAWLVHFIFLCVFFFFCFISLSLYFASASSHSLYFALSIVCLCAFSKWQSLTETRKVQLKRTHNFYLRRIRKKKIRHTTQHNTKKKKTKESKERIDMNSF